MNWLDGGDISGDFGGDFTSRLLSPRANTNWLSGFSGWDSNRRRTPSFDPLLYRYRQQAMRDAAARGIGMRRAGMLARGGRDPSLSATLGTQADIESQGQASDAVNDFTTRLLMQREAWQQRMREMRLQAQLASSPYAWLGELGSIGAKAGMAALLKSNPATGVIPFDVMDYLRNNPATGAG